MFPEMIKVNEDELFSVFVKLFKINDSERVTSEWKNVVVIKISKNKRSKQLW